MGDLADLREILVSCYSPICDSSLDAYREYVRVACAAVAGWRTVVAGDIAGRVASDVGGRCEVVVRTVGCSDGGFVGTRLDGRSAGCLGRQSGEDDAGARQSSEECLGTGVSGGSVVGDADGGFVGISGCGLRGDLGSAGIVRNGGTPELSGGSDCLGSVGDVRRGKHYERNRSRREKAKVTRGSAGHSGFFSGSTEVVQEELRESRAKLLVLENKRKAVQEQRKIDRLLSPMQVVEDAVAMVKMANACAKVSTDNKVAGWARTLAESSAESIARSAPDSLRSLDSVTSARELELKKSGAPGDGLVGAAPSRVSSRSRSGVKAESGSGTRLGGRRVLPGELVRASVLDSGPNFALPSWMEEY